MLSRISVRLIIALATLSWTSHARATVGAVTPFTSFEAETAALGGGAAIIAVTAAPTNQYSSPEMEASGHAFVQLTNTGQSVTWTNHTGENFTALNVRAGIPDAPTGGGLTNTLNLYVNGVFRQSFSVNSLQNYCYEGTNYNGQEDKNPADGHPRGFWNDTHAFINGAPIAPGDTFTLQKDAGNSAVFYNLDVVDLENPPAALNQPANSLSIVSYGAVPNSIGFDNTSAINNCFAAAQAQGKIAWIPAGTFYFSAVNGGLHASGITIAGAGPWYSTLYRVTPANNSQGVNNMVTTTSSTLQDLALDCNSSSRAGNNNNGAVNFSGNNWLVDNVWIQHVTSAFWCSGIGGTARNCRVLSVWSDGGNFNNVENQGANGVGMNLTYSNNFVRGTGDDAMAINSVNYNGSTYYTMMSNITYVNNTAIGPWGGKCIGIYGGSHDVVTNNLLRDTARYIGLGVGKFGVNGSDLVSATVTGNTVLRCGGNGYNQQQAAMMMGNGGDGQSSGTVANAYCASNTIIDSLYSAVSFSTGTNIVFQYNTIVNPALDAIVVGPPYFEALTGSAIINSNTVTGLPSGHVSFTNYSSGFVAIMPSPATGYASANGVSIEPCSEGGFDLTGISSGDWSAYNGINLANAARFVARVAGAGAGGNIEIHLDSSNGTLIGTCPVTSTGSTQNYANVYCDLTGASGTHTVYLVYTGSGSDLFRVQFFGLFPAPLAFSHQLIVGNTYALQALSNGRYVTAANNGTNPLIATSTSIGAAEQFQVFDAGGGNIALSALVNTQYVCADNNGASPLIANRAAYGSWETFTEFDAGNGQIALRAMNNGKYVTTPNHGNSALIASSTTIGTNESFAVIFVTGAAPNTPNDITVTAGNAQATLNWLPAPGATGYNIKRSLSSAGSYTIIAANVSGTIYQDAGLVNGTTYYYVVSATNAAGESVNSAQIIAVPGALSHLGWVASSSTAGSDSPANALDGDLATRWSTGGSQVNGQWFQVDMGVTNVFNKIVLNAVNSANDYPRGYQVTVSNDGLSWSSSVATGTGTSGITAISFTAQAARYIRITQTGSANGTYWSIHEFNVLGAAPFTPSGLTATTVSDHQINLAWALAAGATGYNVKRATAVNGLYLPIATHVPEASYADGSLSNGTSYYYVVSATNIYGESPDSTAAHATTISTAPLPLSVAAGNGQIQFTWPLDHLGWHLEIQTNTLNAGLGTNWVSVPGSDQTNQFTLPVSPDNGSVFFRLAYP